ncbi:hypothetical protein [Brevundimonas goettingensis]|uniref:Uncharacterized protein n=1 Tax=Brevundimonas goettingensis TaxID=2774190 RepID=A0A975C2B7_9CAUL|nr:hypothetical protein [Brevundimonas goettingensis]QTC90277.1 hypothetical protein IFJ75_13445 [Brevundimonas goettingensis]
MQPSPARNRAVMRLKAGKVSAVLKVELTNTGLVAIGGLVCGILVSTAGLVWVATATAREHPVVTALRRR